LGLLEGLSHLLILEGNEALWDWTPPKLKKERRGPGAHVGNKAPPLCNRENKQDAKKPTHCVVEEERGKKVVTRPWSCSGRNVERSGETEWLIEPKKGGQV